jgi:hypothetical protein
MLYSDFCAPTVSTSADTAAATATIKFNGVGGKVLGIWGAGGAQTLTAAQAIKFYAQFTGDGVPSPVPNIPFGMWTSAGLAPQGASSGDATFFPVNWPAIKLGTVTIGVLNAASSTAPLVQVGLIYGTDSLPAIQAITQDPWNIRDIPQLVVTATPTSVTTTAELGVGTITVPPNYTNCVGLTTLGTKNGVVVTAEEFFGTARYTATGATSGQFEPAQNWPFFGQMQAGLGAIIGAPTSMPPGGLPTNWHPLAFGNAQNATLQSLVTLRTAITNASSFQVFGAFK